MATSNEPNPWNPRHPQVLWMASRDSGIRHYADWRENVFSRHGDPRLQNQVETFRQNRSSFAAEDFDEVRTRRTDERLPESDLASENSEDAITWSVFSALEQAAEDGEWWRLFGLESRPAIIFWARNEAALETDAQLYRSIGALLESHHPRKNRSEVDLLLATPERVVLVEVKWDDAPFGGSKSFISRRPDRNAAILEDLAKAAVEAGVLAAGVDVPGVLEEGAYQTLRHLLYANEFSKRGRPCEVYYLLCGAAVRLKPDDDAGRRKYEERTFGNVFRGRLPKVVLWEEVVASLSDAVLDKALPPGEFHAGASLRQYLAGRRVGGKPTPLVYCDRGASDEPLVRWGTGSQVR